MAESTPPSLATTFNLRDPDFCSYMNVLKPGSGDAPPRRLIELASNMSEHPNPLVRYAAGWVATEAGTISYVSGMRHRWTLGNREEVINIGNRIWCGINDEEWKHFAPPNDHARQSQLWSFGIRRLIAMAYLPALHLAARSRAGEPVAAQDAYARFVKIKQDLLPIIGILLDDPDDDSEQSSTMRGLANEVAVAWLLQKEFLQPPAIDTLQPEDIVTPSSIRDDHHCRTDDRCDINAYSLDPNRTPGKRTPVQITGPGNPNKSKCFVVTQRALGGKSETQQEFLRRIYRYEMGYDKTPGRLLVISNNLRQDLKLYKQRPSN